jgi:hypothetical protein
MQGYFGEQPCLKKQSKRQTHVCALAPEGCWISQWSVGFGERGTPNFIRGVLNDGSILPALNWQDRCYADTVIGEEGGSFAAVHGRCVGTLWYYSGIMGGSCSFIFHVCSKRIGGCAIFFVA